MRNVLTTPTPAHIAYIKSQFDLPQKLQEDAMKKKMKEDLPDPKDHLTVEQIEGQTSKFTRQKKKILATIDVDVPPINDDDYIGDL